MTLRVPRTLVYRFNDSSNVCAPSMSKGRLDFEKDAGWPEAQAHCLDGGKERPTARVDATAQDLAGAHAAGVHRAGLPARWHQPRDRPAVASDGPREHQTILHANF